MIYEKCSLWATHVNHKLMYYNKCYISYTVQLFLVWIYFGIILRFLKTHQNKGHQSYVLLTRFWLQTCIFGAFHTSFKVRKLKKLNYHSYMHIVFLNGFVTQFLNSYTILYILYISLINNFLSVINGILVRFCCIHW